MKNKTQAFLIASLMVFIISGCVTHRIFRPVPELPPRPPDIKPKPTLKAMPPKPPITNALLRWNYPVAPTGTNVIVKLYQTDSLKTPPQSWTLCRTIINPKSNATSISVTGRVGFLYGTYRTTNSIRTTNLHPVVRLAWDPSAGTNVVGYKTYFGIASRTYTNSINVGSATTASVSNILCGKNYYFAATALATGGLESDYSNEVSTSIPSVTESRWVVETNLPLSITAVR